MFSIYIKINQTTPHCTIHTPNPCHFVTLKKKYQLQNKAKKIEIWSCFQVIQLEFNISNARKETKTQWQKQTIVGLLHSETCPYSVSFKTIKWLSFGLITLYYQWALCLPLLLLFIISGLYDFIVELIHFHTKSTWNLGSKGFKRWINSML